MRGLVSIVLLGATLVGVDRLRICDCGRCDSHRSHQLAHRIWTAIRYLQDDFKSLPDNFQNVVLNVSIFDPPELIPGLQTGTTAYTTADLWSEFRRARQRPKVSLFVFMFFPAALVLWFVPAAVYRLTLKSTAWFWWPLAYISDEPVRPQGPDTFHIAILSSLWAREHTRGHVRRHGHGQENPRIHYQPDLSDAGC